MSQPEVAQPARAHGWSRLRAALRSRSQDQSRPRGRRPGYHRTLAGRVTLLTLIAVAFAVTAVSFAAYETVRTQSLHTLDDSLRQRAQDAVRTDSLDRLASDRIPAWALGAADLRIIFVNGLLHTEHAADYSGRFPIGPPEYAVAMGKAPSSARTVRVHGVDFRAVTVPGPHGEALTLAQSLEPTERMLTRLGLVMLLIGLAGVIAAALAGWAVARSGLLPVRRLTRAVEEITRTQQLEPIPVEGTDEVARLSASFNAMLAALSASQQVQRQLIADAGHELRTPLTSLRTNLDLLVMAGRDGALPETARRDLLEDVRAQIAEMTTLIGDLIELAREEPAGATSSVEPVELGALVEQAVARVRRRSPSVRFVVHASPWWVLGDAAGLERAVTNLLDNAAKWSPSSGQVLVRLHRGQLTVADEGPGIAETDLPKIFDRFYRSRESRSMPGSGLGLSIVRAVAERHGGWVSASRSRAGGALLRLELPGSTSPPEVLERKSWSGSSGLPGASQSQSAR